LRNREWNALRHGHFAYHSVPAASRLLADVGLTVVAARSYSLYGGSVLLLANRSGVGPAAERAAVEALARDEVEAGVLDPAMMVPLAQAPGHDVAWLRDWVARQPHGAWLYGAGSRAVAVLAAAGLRDRAVTAIVDGAPAKQGRRMPGTTIPIVAPDALLAADPQEILLMLPDLLDELREAWPQLSGRWVVYGDRRPAGPHPAGQRCRSQKISSFGSGTTSFAPQARVYSSWAAISSRRFHGRMRM
jgi:hypothetical protein